MNTLTKLYRGCQNFWLWLQKVNLAKLWLITAAGIFILLSLSLGLGLEIILIPVAAGAGLLLFVAVNRTADLMMKVKLTRIGIVVAMTSLIVGGMIQIVLTKGWGELAEQTRPIWASLIFITILGVGFGLYLVTHSFLRKRRSSK
jgi:hypothetical protein